MPQTDFRSRTTSCRNPAGVLVASPGHDGNHPWVNGFQEALAQYISVHRVIVEVNQEELALARPPQIAPLSGMELVMALRSRTANQIRARQMTNVLERVPANWMRMQLYTNGVYPLGHCEAVFTDMFLATLAEMADAIPGYTWQPTLLRDALAQERELLRSCRWIWVASRWLEHWAKSHFETSIADKISYLGWGPGLQCEKVEQSERKHLPPRILFVGNDADRKGLDLLVQAYARLREGFPEAKLLVVGAAQVDTLVPIDHLGFLSPARPDELQKLKDAYLTSNLFVLPTRFEPVGCAYLEAMSFGLPIIGPCRFAVPEFLRDGITGRFCETEVVSLTNTIRWCFTHPERLAEMGQAARQLQKEEFCWQIVAERLLMALKRINQYE